MRQTDAGGHLTGTVVSAETERERVLLQTDILSSRASTSLIKFAVLHFPLSQAPALRLSALPFLPV